ncbi:MAG: hypothetical protein GX639_00335 [Fibrobacter sp.]|mgnify:CR=1 FL=1|nr:hypothetical protein [Fibrobacter sp.]
MDDKLQRIIQFLRKNNNHYFETSDIAYHLKFDEQYTNDALLYLNQIQFVTLSNDPQGNAVWYAAEHWNQDATECVFEQQIDTVAGKDISDEGSHNNHAFHALIENVEKEKKPFPLGLFIVSVGFILLIGSSLYIGKRYVDRKFDELVIRVNAAATKSEFTLFSEKAISNDEMLGLKTEALSGRIDSTVTAIDSLCVKDSLIQKQIVDFDQKLKADLKRYFRRR